MTGEEFRKLTPAQLDEKLPILQVLARSSPEDKHILVQRLNGGLMPETQEQWEEAHPNKDYDTQRDLLLPGYKEEWAASRGGQRRQHPTGLRPRPWPAAGFVDTKIRS